MTIRSVLAQPLAPAIAGQLRPWVGPAALLITLVGVVAARWFATTRGLDALGVGAGFGLALAALWLAATRGSRAHPEDVPRPSRVQPASFPRRVLLPNRIVFAVAAGMSFGFVLVGLAIAGASIGGWPIIQGLSRPAAPFLPWVGITVVVAAAEEGILRGALFDRLRAGGGIPAAVVVTTVAFAVMHVPLYGWHVVPLDLAVGLGLAGLRLSTRTIVAPAAAHAIADLATWWL